MCQHTWEDNNLQFKCYGAKDKCPKIANPYFGYSQETNLDQKGFQAASVQENSLDATYETAVNPEAAPFDTGFTNLENTDINSQTGLLTKRNPKFSFPKKWQQPAERIWKA